MAMESSVWKAFAASAPSISALVAAGSLIISALSFGYSVTAKSQAEVSEKQIALMQQQMNAARVIDVIAARKALWTAHRALLELDRKGLENREIEARKELILIVDGVESVPAVFRRPLRQRIAALLEKLRAAGRDVTMSGAANIDGLAWDAFRVIQEMNEEIEGMSAKIPD